MSVYHFIDDLHRALMQGVPADELIDRHEGDWAGLMDTLCECGEAIGIEGAAVVPADPLMPLQPIGNLRVADHIPPVRLKVRLQMKQGFAAHTDATERWSKVFFAIYLAGQQLDGTPSTYSPDDAGTPPYRFDPPALGHQGPTE